VKGCERVRDFGRAAEWCKRLQDYSAGMRLNSMFAICRTQYAEILMWHGEWGNAEQELNSAKHEIETTRPGNLGSALTRLAKLRVRQGRFEDARALLAQLGQDTRSELVRAELALELDAAGEAEELAQKVLRRLSPENRIDTAAGLELLVRALTVRKALAAAQDALARLEVIAREVGTPPLAAFHSLSAGLVCRCRRDLEAAKRHFEDAADLFQECGAPFEEGRARLELAQTWDTLGRRDLALREARAAHLCLYRVGAKTYAARALAIVDGVSGNGEAASAAAPAFNLTRREQEVLRLIAQGLTNSKIGTQLFISEHTVHRHVANILSKLDLPSRAAAAAHAAAQGLV
jgi:DNA-binding CsgD family transcriptional regulator